jgi:hypothetical protein
VEGELLSLAETAPDMAKHTFVSVKIDAEVRRLAKIVAAYQDKDLGVYLSERLLPLVKEDLARHQEEAAPVSKPRKKE